MTRTIKRTQGFKQPWQTGERGPKVVFEPAPDFQPNSNNPAAGVKFSEEASRLKNEMPGDWAKIAVCKNASAAQSLATNIRRGRRQAFQPAKDWEAASRGNDVYARYVKKPRRR